MKKDMRLFIALGITYNCQEDIIKTTSKLKRQQSLGKEKTKFVSMENLHLTLIPPWNDGNLEEVKFGLRKLDISKFPKPFTIHFVNYEAGPHPETPRLLWIRGEENSLLEDLVKKLSEITGSELPKRDYIPHITIARFGKEGGRFWKGFCDEVNLTVLFDCICLLGSKLSPDGAKYETLEKIELK